MDSIAVEFKDKGVVFYTVYTKEPHAGQKMRNLDFSNYKQTKTHEERVTFAKEVVRELKQKRSILIDTFEWEKTIQYTLGGGAPNSMLVIDKEGKAALYTQWSDAKILREKLEEMTAKKK